MNDRSEDNLTVNFFGALRYIPFDLVLRNILSAGVYPSKVGDLIGKISADFWSDKLEFWPHDKEGVIDAVLNFDDTIPVTKQLSMDGKSASNYDRKF